MTAAGVQSSPPGAVPAPLADRPAVASLRLAWLYLVSRRAPAALGLLAGLGALLWAALHWQWNISGGPAAQQLIPLTIETGAAAVIAVTTHGPFGDPERAHPVSTRRLRAFPGIQPGVTSSTYRRITMITRSRLRLTC